MQQRQLNLKQRIYSRPCSYTHLQLSKFEHFIQFCDPHQQITTLMGSSRTCRKSCMMCTPNCQKHRQTDNRHSQMTLVEFIEVVRQVKAKYRQYHDCFLKQVLPDFLRTLKQVVLGFMEELEKWNAETVLVEEFLSISRNANLVEVISKDVHEWDLSDLTCKDVNELVYMRDKLESRSQEQNHEQIKNILKQMLEYSLKYTELIPTRMDPSNRQILLDGHLDEVTAKIAALNRRIETLGIGSPAVNTGNLALYLNTGTEYYLPRPEANPGDGQLTPPVLDLKQIEEEIDVSLGKFVQMFEEYSRKCNHKTIKIHAKIPAAKHEFWEELYDKIFGLLKAEQIRGELGTLIFYCYDNRAVAEHFYQYLNEEDKELAFGVKPAVEAMESIRGKSLAEQIKQERVVYYIKNMKFVFQPFREYTRTRAQPR